MSKGFAELQLKRVTGMSGPITEAAQQIPNINNNINNTQQAQN